MKRLLLSVLAALSFSAQADVIGVAEYDYHKWAGADSSSGYYAAGLIFVTEAGSFDAYWQGVTDHTNGVRDTLNGWEVGYGLFIAGDKVNVLPRIAYGAMTNINVGYNAQSRYLLASIELQTPLTGTIGGYVGTSHMKGLTADAIQSNNRLQAGVDVALSEKTVLRVGYSFVRQFQANQNGVVTMLFHTF